MRVKRGEHPVNRGLDQRALVHVLDIFGADAVEDVAEEVELLIDAGTTRRFLRDQRPGHLCRHHQSQRGTAQRGEKRLLHAIHPYSASANQSAGFAGP